VNREVVFMRSVIIKTDLNLSPLILKACLCSEIVKLGVQYTGVDTF